MTDEKTMDIKDFKGIVRAPKIVTKQGRVMIDLGVIDSPALATAIALSVNKTALEVKQLRNLTEWAIKYQDVFNTYSEKMDFCDCPICQAKAYVKEQGMPIDEAAVERRGHYL